MVLELTHRILEVLNDNTTKATYKGIVKLLFVGSLIKE